MAANRLLIPMAVKQNKNGSTISLDYDSVINSIKEEFRGNKEIYGILVFGSVPRNDAVPRFSDVDAILVVNHDFVIPRGVYEDVSESVRKVVEKNEIFLDIAVLDKKLPRTKFTTAGPNFKEHLRNTGEVIVGEDVRNLFSKGSYFIGRNIGLSEARGSIAWNLVTTRKNAIYLEHRLVHDKKRAEVTMQQAVRSLTAFSRNAIQIKTGIWVDDKAGIEEQFKEEFGNLAK
jgi:predicted nucleotidyltransferase